jgi:hypothetical protein
MIDLDQLEEQAVVAGGLPVVGLSSEITASPVETTPPTSQPEGRPTSPRLTENNQTVAFASALSRIDPGLLSKSDPLGL